MSYRRRITLFDIFGKWALIIAFSLLACLTCFTARRSLTSGTDFLGGREEVQYFFKINLTCLITTAVATLANIIVFFKACVGKDNSDMRKPVACVIGLIISLFSCVAFILSTANIASDLAATTTARPATYVLCTNAQAGHFVGFTDRGEMALVPVDTSTYEALQKGHELEMDKAHSDVFEAIASRSYTNVVEYDSAVRIEYYFNSAMIEKAELLFE